MNNKKYNTVSTNSTGTENGFSVDVSEVDTLLSQLLPHPEDASMHIEPESLMYKDIHRVRLNTGINAVSFQMVHCWLSLWIEKQVVLSGSG